MAHVLIQLAAVQWFTVHLLMHLLNLHHWSREDKYELASCRRHMITSLSLTEALLTLHDTGQEEHSNPQCSYDRQPDRLQQAAHSVSSSSTHDGLEGRDDQGLPLNGIDAAEQAMQCPCLYLDLRSYMDIAPPSVQ